MVGVYRPHPLSPTGHRSHIPLPMRKHNVAIVDDFFQHAMFSSALGEHTVDDPQSVSTQFHQNIGKVAHDLRHVNLNTANVIGECFLPFDYV